ncbi:MAG: aminotransferase class V-fold PLP-dependent enzyme [Chloroflexota bacterium]
MDPFLPDDAKLDAIRELLPSLASGMRLDVTVAGPFPAETDRAIRQFDEHTLRVGRGGVERPEEVAQRAEEAASVVAAVLATTPDRVVLTPGPVAAISAALVALAPSAIVPHEGLPGTLASDIETIAQAHRLRLSRDRGSSGAGGAIHVASHVDATTGAMRDLGVLATEVHAARGSLLLDLGWSAGAVPIDVPGSGADLALVEGHRWLLGPEGVTALWASDPTIAARIRSLMDHLPPSLLLGLARSVGWLLMYVGLPWAFERVGGLAQRLQGALGAIEGVTLGSGPSTAAALPFRVAGWSADEVADELLRRAHAHLEVDASRGLLVASVGAWTRGEEVDRLAGAVAEIAAHTPQTLPRRPLLTMLGSPAVTGR